MYTKVSSENGKIILDIGGIRFHLTVAQAALLSAKLQEEGNNVILERPRDPNMNLRK